MTAIRLPPYRSMPDPCARHMIYPDTELQIIFKSKGQLPPTFENYAYLHISFALSTSEKIAYMYTFKIMFDTSVIQ
jgi:hypothetical protein